MADAYKRPQRPGLELVPRGAVDALADRGILFAALGWPFDIRLSASRICVMVGFGTGAYSSVG
jgi:hypothetical protein